MPAFNWNPITATKELIPYQSADYPTLAYMLMNRMGMAPESSYASSVSQDIMPLMATLLETYLKATPGALAGDPTLKQGNQTSDTVNRLGQMLSQVMQPGRAIPGEYSQLGSGNLAQNGIGFLQSLAKGGFNQGTVQDVALSDPSRLWQLTAGLEGNQLGGNLAQQFFSANTLAALQGQFKMRQAAGNTSQNFLAFLQEMGWLPGDYKQSQPTIPDPLLNQPELNVSNQPTMPVRMDQPGPTQTAPTQPGPTGWNTNPRPNVGAAAPPNPFLGLLQGGR